MISFKRTPRILQFTLQIIFFNLKLNCNAEVFSSFLQMQQLQQTEIDLVDSLEMFIQCVQNICSGSEIWSFIRFFE